MSVVRLLPALVARCVQRAAVRDDDVIAAVGGWVEDGFVLAHEQNGDSGGEAAQRWWSES